MFEPPLGRAGQLVSGTAHVKYNPIITTEKEDDTGTSIDVKYVSINTMEEYKGKCLAELRLEDYIGGRGREGVWFALEHQNRFHLGGSPAGSFWDDSDEDDEPNTVTGKPETGKPATKPAAADKPAAPSLFNPGAGLFGYPGSTPPAEPATKPAAADKPAAPSLCNPNAGVFGYPGSTPPAEPATKPAPTGWPEVPSILKPDATLFGNPVSTPPAEPATKPAPTGWPEVPSILKPDATIFGNPVSTPPAEPATKPAPTGWPEVPSILKPCATSFGNPVSTPPAEPAAKPAPAGWPAVPSLFNPGAGVSVNPFNTSDKFSFSFGSNIFKPSETPVKPPETTDKPMFSFGSNIFKPSETPVKPPETTDKPMFGFGSNIFKPTETPVKPPETTDKPMFGFGSNIFKLSESPVKPSETPVKPSESPVKPTETPVKPLETTDKPMFGFGSNIFKLSESPVKPSETPVKPSESPVKPTETPVKPLETTDKPMFGFGSNIFKLSESTVKPSETPVKPSESPVKPTETPVKPSDASAKPLFGFGSNIFKPSETPVKPSESPVKPSDTAEKPSFIDFDVSNLSDSPAKPLDAYKGHSGPSFGHEQLISELKAKGVIKSEKVAKAMLAVDRQKFCLKGCQEPYKDAPQRLRENVNISAPHMHARALELLKDQLVEGATALDVGCGSGYITACMAVLVGAGKVVGIDIDPLLVNLSQCNIHLVVPELEDHVSVIVGDGRLGCSQYAPYDAIHVGAAAPQLLQELINQLKPGGRLIMPVGPPRRDQQLVQLDKKADGSTVQKNIMSVIFGSLTGKQIDNVANTTEKPALPVKPNIFKPTVSTSNEKFSYKTLPDIDNEPFKIFPKIYGEEDDDEDDDDDDDEDEEDDDDDKHESAAKPGYTYKTINQPKSTETPVKPSDASAKPLFGFGSNIFKPSETPVKPIESPVKPSDTAEKPSFIDFDVSNLSDSPAKPLDAYKGHSGPSFGHEQLISELKARGVIKSEKVAKAMLAVDRQKFCLKGCQEPYKDAPQRLRENVNISAPHMHARALELLKDQLVEGATALDVGCGSGYITACMAVLVGAGKVVGIDIDPLLVNLSQCNIHLVVPELEDHVSVIVGDGRLGCSQYAPYDAIHVGAAAPHLLQELINQLKPGGRLIMPVGPPRRDQQLVQLDKKADGSTVQKNIMSVIFGSLTGKQIDNVANTTEKPALPVKPNIFKPTVSTSNEKFSYKTLPDIDNEPFKILPKIYGEEDDDEDDDDDDDEDEEDDDDDKHESAAKPGYTYKTINQPKSMKDVHDCIDKALKYFDGGHLGTAERLLEKAESWHRTDRAKELLGKIRVAKQKRVDPENVENKETKAPDPNMNNGSGRDPNENEPNGRDPNENKSEDVLDPSQPTPEQIEDVRRVLEETDDYVILGLSRTCDDVAAVNKAKRRQLVCFTHTRNRAPGATEAFRRVADAAETVIKNIESR